MHAKTSNNFLNNGVEELHARISEASSGDFGERSEYHIWFWVQIHSDAELGTVRRCGALIQISFQEQR